LHEALLYKLPRPEPENHYLSFADGAARVYQMCAERDGKVLARILKEIQPIQDSYARHEKAMEIFYSSLTGGHLFPGYHEFGRREIAKEIARYFGIRQNFDNSVELETFINKLGEYLCGEKQLPAETETETTR
jgi:hypothetical protein